MKPTIHFTGKGDFYNAYHQDARDAAKPLGAVLTKIGGAHVVGVPKHAVLGAIDTLTKQGFSVKFNAEIQP